MVLRKHLPGIVVPLVACANRQSVGYAEPVEELDEKIFHPHLIEFLEDVGSCKWRSGGIAYDEQRRQEVVGSRRHGLLEVQPIDEPCRFR